MRRSYKSLLHFQEVWSSLQTRSRTSTNAHQGRRLQTRTLGNFQVRITSKMCSKNFQTTSNCGSWVSRACAFREKAEPTSRSASQPSFWTTAAEITLYATGAQKTDLCRLSTCD